MNGERDDRCSADHAMHHHTDAVQRAGRPPWSEHGPRQGTRRRGGLSGLVRFVYDTNPFYLLSALLFLYAQTRLFGTRDPWINTTIPLLLIAGYTALMAGAAVLIVRAGQVWDDARSILVIVVVLFMVLSVSADTKVLEILDKVLRADGARAWYGGFLNKATGILASGWAFAALLSWALCRGLRLRLRRPFYGVYLAVLGLFFLYPYVPARLLVTANGPEAAMRAIMAFPACMGLAFLGLVPAIRRGPAYAAADTGTPWGWPWYPWALFGILGFGVCARTYLMTLSFVPGKGFGSFRLMDTGFGAYMLIPFLLAAAILLLEHGLTAASPRLVATALAAPLAFVCMVPFSPMTGTSAYAQFARAAVGSNGSLLAVAVLGTLALYGYAWWRKVRSAEVLFLIALVLGTAADWRTDCLVAVGMPHELLLYGPGLVLAWIAHHTRNSFWSFASLCSLVGACALQFTDTWVTAGHAILPLHVLYAGTLLIAILEDDWFAAVLRHVTAVLLPVMCLGALAATPAVLPSLPGIVTVLYVMGLLCIAVAGFFVLGCNTYLYAGIVCVVLCSVKSLTAAVRDVSAIGMRGVHPMLGAAALFAVALLISLAKGGVLQRLWRTGYACLDHARARFRGLEC